MARTLSKNKWIKFPEDEEIQFKLRPFSPLHLKSMPTSEKKQRQVSCEECKSTHLLLQNKLPDCRKPSGCNWKPVDDDNLDFIHIIQKYSLFIAGSDGKLDMNTLQFIIDNEDVGDINKFIYKLKIFYGNGYRVKNMER